jgi:hypothetical protein
LSRMKGGNYPAFYDLVVDISKRLHQYRTAAYTLAAGAGPAQLTLRYTGSAILYGRRVRAFI